MQGPLELLSNPFHRRVVGIVLLFVAFVVWPQVFGVGPLSTTVATSLVSADYNPSDGYLLLTVNLFQGVDAPSEVLGVRLSPSSRDAYKVDLPETFLRAELTGSEFYYNYVRSGESLPEVVCYSAEGVVEDVGLLKGYNDLANAVRDAYDRIVSEHGDPSSVFGPGNYKLIVLRTWFEEGFLFFGGVAKADVLLCGYVPDRYYLYSQSGSPELRSCFRLSLSTADGRTAAVTSEICNDVGAGKLFQLTSGGTVVGTAVYNGWKKSYWPPGVSTFPAVHLLVDRHASQSDGLPPTGVFLVTPSVSATLSNYRSAAEQFLSNLRSAETVSCENLEGYGFEIAISPFRDVLDVPFVIHYLDGRRCDVSSVPSPDYWSSQYRVLRSSLKSLMSHPVSRAGFEYDARLPDSITLIKDMSGYSRPLASHEMTLRLSAKFTGLYFLRARPRILAVSPVGECTDTKCTLSVRVKNDTASPREVGPVTVTVSGEYLYGQAVVTFSSPGQTKEVRVEIFPRGVTSTVTDRVKVTVTAAHPLDPVTDTYTLSVNIEKAPTCTISSPICYYDLSRGLWYYVYCPDVFSSPQKVWCAEGQGCSDGTGCVDDFIKSVSCLDSRTYEVVYQYAGVTSGVCDAGYVCDANLAAQNVVPPCVLQRDPFVPSVPSPSPPSYHVAEHRPSLRDIALGIALIGLALVVMP